tara:strand:- start:307 stop:561 length:255 start_codon:yes stop_codon:yes gene_type:complete
MSQPSSDQQSLLDFFDAEAYLDQVGPFIIGLPNAAYREGVLTNLKTAKVMAEKVFAVELERDCCDLSAVFTPVATADVTRSQEP